MVVITLETGDVHCVL